MRLSIVEDAQMIAKWILDDPKLMEHLPVINEKEALDFSKSLVDNGDKQASFIYLQQDIPCALGTLFLTDYIKLRHHAQLMLIVKKEERNQGIGSKVLEQLLSKAKEAKLEYIDIELYDNSYAGFFEKRDFKSYATQMRYLKIENGYFARTLYRRYL